MDLTSWLFVPGLVGGVVVAVALRVVGSRVHPRLRSDPFAGRAAATDVINASAIRVAGLGGLGLVGMAFALAWTFPRIGQSVALSAALGVAMAVFLIWRRRHTGPLPTSSGRLGANTTLSIDAPSRVERAAAPHTHRPTVEELRVAGTL